MTSKRDRLEQWETHFENLINNDLIEAIRQARDINLDALDADEYVGMTSICAAVLVDAGGLTGQRDAVVQGLSLFRELQALFPTDGIAYNIANGLMAIVGQPPSDQAAWLNHQESTRENRAEARRNLWAVANNGDGDSDLRSQAWTNIGNQFSNSYRLFEAHDVRLIALEIEPKNGVAAIAAADNLMWLYHQVDCSDETPIEAAMLARITRRNMDRVVKYAGAQLARQVLERAERYSEPPLRTVHKDPFTAWVESERLALGPTVELVNPSLGKIDWLMLPGILEREKGAGATPPPVFAMFNSLKSDYILARDLAWRAGQQNTWPTTGKFADTLDYAVYGPEISALVLAHRTALDLLDKVAVTANYYFELGKKPKEVVFGKLWREAPVKNSAVRPLTDRIRKIILGGAPAIYGLVELAEDYESEEGILRSQKNLRNAGTHRFVSLHDIGDPMQSRHADEIERHRLEDFTSEVLRALRLARSAIQMLTLAITQHERGLAKRAGGKVGSLMVPDHDYIRGREE